MAARTRTSRARRCESTAGRRRWRGTATDDALALAAMVVRCAERDAVDAAVALGRRSARSRTVSATQCAGRPARRPTRSSCVTPVTSTVTSSPSGSVGAGERHPAEPVVRRPQDAWSARIPEQSGGRFGSGCQSGAVARARRWRRRGCVMTSLPSAFIRRGPLSENAICVPSVTRRPGRPGLAGVSLDFRRQRPSRSAESRERTGALSVRRPRGERVSPPSFVSCTARGGRCRIAEMSSRRTCCTRSSSQNTVEPRARTLCAAVRDQSG